MLDEKTKKELIADFTKYLNSAKLSDNTLKYTNTITQTTKTKRATIQISTTAYLKMLLYVRDTTTEIAWHGTVTKDKDTYLIHDVFLYPQKLSAATVTTDQEAYNKWCEQLDDEHYNSMRLQGHSHVNFGVSPSGTDTNFYNSILQVLPKNDFYIFMILNKAGDSFFTIYDLENNLIYEKTDIDIQIIDKNQDILALIKDEKDNYCEKPIPQGWQYREPVVTPYTNPYHERFNNPQYTQTGFYMQDNDYEMTETDMLYAELDNKFKNATLKAPKKSKKKGK